MMEFSLELDGSLSPQAFAIITGYPLGLCGDRTEHLSHVHESDSLGTFFCTADQRQREPYRSERANRQP